MAAGGRARPGELDAAGPGLRLASAAGRWVVAATILGSTLVGIDATVVGIALPRIGTDLDAGFDGLQWTITGYTVTLASLVLLGGAAGDRFGRRRVFLWGTASFTAASAACALAPSIQLLVAARVLQGVGGALLLPASLAILEAVFAEADRAAAVGTWAGFSGVAAALSPFVGGWILGLGSWRWLFLLNVPVAVLVTAVTVRHMPESRDESAPKRLDWAGALTTCAGLGALTYALIAAGNGSRPTALVAAAVAVAAALLFVLAERRAAFPLLPFALFRIRQFSAVNAVTLAVYGALAAFFFLLVLQLQVVLGWSALRAGTAVIPVTILTLTLSRTSGRLAGRIGPRLPMTLGPLLCAGGALVAGRIGPGASYAADVLPAVLMLGLGLAAMVAPLTSVALGSVPSSRAGVASGFNNAVARTGALMATAGVPVLTGLTGDVLGDPERFATGFRSAMTVCAVLFALGALLAGLWIRRPAREVGSS